jgi:hypothetical protein
MMSVDLVELAHHLPQPRRVLQQIDHRPRRHHRGGVVTCEHHRDEHAADLVVAVAPLAVLVPQPAEHLEEVLVGLAAALAPLEDRLEPGDELPTGAIPGPQYRDRQVRVHVGQGVRAALEVHEDRHELRAELLAELRADQAAGRGVERELRKEREQVDLALLRPARGHALDLGGDLLRVTPHELVPQGLVPHGLLALLGGGVEDHALAEDRLHERIGGRLVELLVRSAEERLLGLLPGQEHDPMTREPELADLSALAPQPLHQREGIAAQLQQVAQQRPAAPEDRGRGTGPARSRRREGVPGRLRGGSHGLDSCWGSKRSLRCLPFARNVNCQRLGRRGPRGQPAPGTGPGAASLAWICCASSSTGHGPSAASR